MIRHRIAVYGLLALAVLTVFDFLLSVPGLVFSDIDKFDKHVVEVLPDVPSYGTVGYWSDLEGNTAVEQTLLQEYYLTQYALAPRVVVRSIGQNIVITHAHSANSRLPGANLQLVRDYGDGLKIFRKKTQ